jgi:integrase
VALTVRNVPTLPAAEGRETLWWDTTTPGFYLAVSPPSSRFPKGVRSYGVWYRVRGRSRQKRFGRHPVVGLAVARERARQILEAARVRQVDLAGAPAGRRLVDVVEAFIDAAAKRKPRRHADSTLDNYRMMVKAYIKDAPAGRTSIDELRSRDLDELVVELAEDVPVTANRVLQLIRATFRWAMKQEITDRDPTFAVEMPVDEGGGKERVLRDDELAVLWRACEDDATQDMTRPGPSRAARRRTDEDISAGIQRAALARLILLTGARPGEASLLNWSEIEQATVKGGRRLWHVPAEHRKGQRGRKRPHIFPLSDIAATVLDELHGETGRGRRAFPFTSADKYNPHWVDPLRERAAALGLTEPWTAHDLRRTCSTGLSRLGYTRSVIAIVLGHTLQEGGTVTGVYDRFDRMPERAAALEAWGAHVLAIASTVVT